jgi:Ca2+-binding EF-hand superfamily protein
MFDKDKNGTISANEIKEVLGFGAGVGLNAIEDIIREVDENGDGEI